MDLTRFIKVLWQRRWLIAAVVFIAAASAIAFALITPSVYKSSAQLATGITDDTDIALSQEQQAMNFFTIQNKFSNLTENMNSRQVLSLLAYNLALHDLQENTPFQDLSAFNEEYPPFKHSAIVAALQSKRDSIQVLTRLNGNDALLLDVLKSLDYDIGTIEDNLAIDRIPSTDYVKVEYFSENPLLSAFAVNTLAQEFIRYYLTARGERSNSSIQFLVKLVQDKREDLEAKVNELKEFKSSNEVVNLAMQSESIIQQITDLETNREEERKNIIVYEQAIKRINQQLTSSDLNVLERQAKVINSRIVRLKDKITELNNQIIRSGSQEEALLRQLEELRTELNEQILAAGSATSPANAGEGLTRQKLLTDRVNSEVELEIAKASLASINREISRLRGNVSGFASKEAQINAYERDIEVAQNEYVSAVNKLNEAQLVSQNLGGSLRQVEFGYPADDPIQSRDILVIALAIAVSFFLTVVSIIVLEYVDSSPKTPEFFERLTGLSTVGYLNRISEKHLRPDYLFQSIVKDDNVKIYHELLRNLRHEVESSGAQICLVSSLKPKEGKTTFILSMALALSLIRKRVLIIDTNLRRNKLTQLFSGKSFLERVPQLSESELLQYPSGTGFKGVDFIGCEGGNLTPEELFPEGVLSSVMEVLRTKYDYIFLEGSALNQYADTKELLTYADRLLIVAAADQQISSTDENAISYLQKESDKFLGAVLNKCNPANI